MTTLFFDRTVGYTDKLSHINMILNFFKKRQLFVMLYIRYGQEQPLRTQTPQKSYNIDTFHFF